MISALDQATVVAVDTLTAPAPPPISALTRDFLTWVAAGPRSYREAMAAWRSSCPRFTIWEDAIADGLIALERPPGAGLRDTVVALTVRGHAALDR